MNLVERASQNLFSFSKSKEIQTQPIVKGEVVVGKIIGMNEDGTVRIQIGNVETSAKIQNPLKLNGTYAFVVTGVEGNQIELKPADQSLVNRLSHVISAILEDWNMDATPENKRLLEAILVSGKGVSKDEFVSMLTLVKNSMSKNDIDTLLLMLERNLPMNKEVFNAIHNTQVQSSLKEQIVSLIQSLPNTGDNKIENLKDWFQTFFSKNNTLTLENESFINKAELAKEKVSNLDSHETIFNSPKTTTLDTIKNIFANIKQTMPQSFFQGKSFELTQQAVKFLEAQFSKISTEEWNLLSAGTNATKINTLEAIGARLEPKEMLRLVQTLMNLKNDATVKNEANLFVDRKMPLEKLLKSLFDEPSLGSTELRNSDSIASQRQEMNVNNKVEIDKLGSFIKNSISSLGMQWEHFVKRETFKEDQLFTQLKPLLLLMSKDDSLPGQVRNEVDLLVSRLTGLQLLASHSNGPLDFISLQIPMQHSNINSDMSIKWQGKRKEDGKIDPDFCRIFFHLDLESLGPTSLDVQIVSRVIGVRIFCQEDIDTMVADGMADLTVRLSAHNYKMGTIQLNPQPLSLDDVEKSNMSTVPNSPNLYYRGVDLRI